MKTKLITIVLVLTGTWCGFSQGFVNLNFESANVSGYSPLDFVPIANALPGWSASEGIIVYDGISTGGAFISIVDTNAIFRSMGPLQGRYSVWLFGAGGVSETISQTGLVPTGMASLLFAASASSATFIVTLGGQILNVIPMQIFSNYTLYGADISPFAGQVATLSFTEPPAQLGSPAGIQICLNWTASGSL